MDWIFKGASHPSVGEAIGQGWIHVFTALLLSAAAFAVPALGSPAPGGPAFAWDSALKTIVRKRVAKTFRFVNPGGGAVSAA